MTTMKDLSTAVDDAGGVQAVTLGTLRDAVSGERLGKYVMQRIKSELAAHGLGYFPRDVLDGDRAPRQHHEVRVYRKGSGTAAKAIEAVLDPSSNGDKTLTELNTDDSDILDKVRELVCPDSTALD